MNKFAVIDVGSNSVRLLFVADGKLLYKRIHTTRLGEGIAHTPYLKDEAIKRTAQAIADFCLQARQEGAQEIFAFATAAVRSAKNKEAFFQAVDALCGQPIDLLSGEEEAEIGLLGALGRQDGGVIDIGGGSTEIVVRREEKIVYRKSVNIGVVRLNDLCGRDKEHLEQTSKKAIQVFEGFPQLSRGEKVYALGGTATTLAGLSLNLASYDGSKINGCTLPLKEVEGLVGWLAKTPVEEIAKHPCVSKGREDVLLGGGVLLSSIMKKWGLTEVTVSDRDNLEGYAIRRGLME